MPLSKDLREFVELFNATEVEYLVVGAFALAFHGIPRYTADLDLLIHSSSSNVERVLAALERFGFAGLGIEAADLQKPASVVQLGINPNRIDLLTSIDGVSFAEAWQTRVDGPLDGIHVHYVGKAALLKNKQSTGRARDLADAEELQKRMNT